MTNHDTLARRLRLAADELEDTLTRRHGPSAKPDVAVLLLREAAEALSAPGMVLVPREPTEAMVSVLYGNGTQSPLFTQAATARYRAMLAAALTAQAASNQEGGNG